MAEMSRDNARKTEFYGGTLEECVNALLKFQNRGESIVIDFKGHQLYSCDVTMDSAYLEVCGKTKAEYDKEREKLRKEYLEERTREEAEVKAKIPAWIKKGEAFIYPERAEEWKKCVEIRASDLYHGMDLDAAIEIMEKLESGATLDEAKELLDSQYYSGSLYGIVTSIIFSFSKQGPEFWEHIAHGKLSPEIKMAIANKKKENAELAELHKHDSTKEVSAERRREEQEITDSSTEKEQLTSEISDIEQQLQALRAKEAELKKALGEKQSQLNGLEEK